jgi:predicted nucleotidyltransferase
MRTSIAAFAAAALVWPLAARADETGLAYSHDLVKAGGRLCFADHWHSGSGEGASKDAARAAAVRSWADFVDLEYGSSWARFSVAAGAKTQFTKAEKGWSATIEARPCRG